MKLKFIASFSVLFGFGLSGFSQVLHLQDALNRSVENFDRIKSKQALLQASEQNIAYQRKQLLPDLTLAAQQSFGTINAQNGPLYAYGGLGAASTSMPLAEQNWNAAFGSLYFANVNWNVFTFGKLKQEINVAKSKEKTAFADLEQEIFQHQIKVSANYLSLLASQRIKYVQEKNLDRAKVFHEITATRANSGLIPEVEASLAKAEVSNAQSQQIKAYDKELEFSKNLAVLLGDKFQPYQLDSLFSTSIPFITAGQTAEVLIKHPLLNWQQSKINQSVQSETLMRKYRLPAISAFGVVQGRGSGFDWNYVQDNSAYSSSYTKGVGIDRSNYLLGLTLSWNLTNIFRQNSKVGEQQFVTKSLIHEHQLLNEELNAQAALAKAKTKNAVENFEETKVQLTAAQQAYLQHKALYENGLTNLVDYTQTLYSLNRAEIDFEIAQNNVWQALLLQAAAHGDLNVLLNAIQK
jgi:outer membrane protein